MCDEEIITLAKSEKVIKNLQNGKAPQEDYINSELYKCAPKYFLFRLLNFYNIYTSGETSTECNNAVTTIIFKKGGEKTKITDALAY
jgi:hypothetical protein